MDTAEQRRALKDRMEQTRLELIHTASCRLLPDRLALLDQMPRRARVAEVGVAFGDFTQEILERCAPRKLFLIDLWESSRYAAGLSRIEKRHAAAIEAGTVEIRRGRSVDILRSLAPASLDWVYIDTDHSYATTLGELETCEKLIAPGGRIAGHDFCTGNVIDAVPYGVVEAVTRFCREFDWQFEYLTVESRGHFSFCIRRI